MSSEAGCDIGFWKACRWQGTASVHYSLYESTSEQPRRLLPCFEAGCHAVQFFLQVTREFSKHQTRLEASFNRQTQNIGPGLRRTFGATL